MCRNNIARKCTFTADLCWWKHSEEQVQDIECFFCENTFESRTSVMMHRKRIHPKTVKPCTQFWHSKCSFKEDTCWFKHEGGNQSDIEKENLQGFQSGFREGSNDLEPPLIDL